MVRRKLMHVQFEKGIRYFISGRSDPVTVIPGGLLFFQDSVPKRIDDVVCNRFDPRLQQTYCTMDLSSYHVDG